MYFSWSWIPGESVLPEGWTGTPSLCAHTVEKEHECWSPHPPRCRGRTQQRGQGPLLPAARGSVKSISHPDPVTELVNCPSSATPPVIWKCPESSSASVRSCPRRDLSTDEVLEHSQGSVPLGGRSPQLGCLPKSPPFKSLLCVIESWALVSSSTSSSSHQMKTSKSF